MQNRAELNVIGIENLKTQFSCQAESQGQLWLRLKGIEGSLTPRKVSVQETSQSSALLYNCHPRCKLCLRVNGPEKTALSK